MGGAGIALAAEMIGVEIKAKNFGDVPVLGPMSFSLAPGELLAITGPSGAGKTTLMRILAGLEPDFDGEVKAPGTLSMIFQEPVLLPWRSALENITLTTGASRAAAEKALADVGLEGFGARFPRQLSLGQQRRLAMARAFSTAPDLLLLDEPFVSLDPALTEEMLKLTESLLAARPIAAVLVTHSEAEAKRLATRRARLSGRPAELIEG